MARVRAAMLRAAGEAASREARGRPAIYNLHKYWARRPGSLVRLMILGALLPPGADLLKSLRELEPGAKMAGGAAGEGPLVLDPFMGGGTTVVEALRLGCRAVGVDSNPLAWFITRTSLSLADPRELDEAVATLVAGPGEGCRRWYAARCPRCDDPGAQAIYSFWVRQLPCPGCGRHLDLFTAPPPAPDLLEPGMGLAAGLPGSGEGLAAGLPGPTGPARGEVICPHCRCRARRTPAVVAAVERLGGPLPLRLYALRLRCPGCGFRGFRPAEAADLALVQAADRELAARRAALPLPAGAIPDGLKTRDLIRHGFRRWEQLFSPRQLLCLGELLAAILALPPGPVRDLLLLTFSDSLNANNLLCKYNRRAQKLEPLFGLHAYHLVDQPVENHVWGAGEGRGSFARYLEKSRRAQGWLRQETPGRRPPALHCRDARSLTFIPDGAVDAVVTDPPYFDSVQYGELSHFFYSWLQPVLARELGPFAAPAPGGETELVVDGRSRTGSGYARGLGAVWRECRRVLRPGGVLIFTFHHRQPAAWAALVESLLAGGWSLAAAYPLLAEGRGGLHSAPGNLKCEVVLAGRKGLGPGRPLPWPVFLARVQRLTRRRAAAIGVASGTTEWRALSLAQAACLYTRRRPVDAVGQPLPVLAALTGAAAVS